MHHLINKEGKNLISFYSGPRQELCNWETFAAQCQEGQVILMTSAKYGRMQHGRCIRKTFDEQGNLDPIGCHENIIRYIFFC